MHQERHLDHPQKDFIKEFEILVNSGYWLHLPQKTKEDILSMLAEYRDDYAEKH